MTIEVTLWDNQSDDAREHTFRLVREDDNLVIETHDGQYLGSLWLHDGKLTLGYSPKSGADWIESHTISATYVEPEED